MTRLYPTQKVKAFSSSVIRIAVAALLLTATFSVAVNAQSTTTPELIFKNSTLISGTSGADAAVYRFPAISSGIDALVKITGRSSGLVQLVSIDISNMGHDKAFQPQVTYNNGNTTGAADWWMEFEISFVQTNTTNSVNVKDFDVTALDIDGNGDKINEYVSFYNQKSYMLEGVSQLHVANLLDLLLGLLTPGKRFDGPVTNYVDIDTSATGVMTTNSYHNNNAFKVRTGGKSTGASSVADRMYSFWFKGFKYDKPVQATLPVSIINWNAAYSNNNVSLKWTTTVEKNLSHFIIERSFDGADYTDAAMIVAVGNSESLNNYSFNDKVPAGNTGVIYYRLRSVDMDGRNKTTEVKIVRIGKSSDGVKIIAYPNPVVSEVRITIPQNWQDKAVTYQVANTNGQTIKTFTIQHASQTEIISMAQVPAGMYIMKVTSGNETSTQAIVKSKD